MFSTKVTTKKTKKTAVVEEEKAVEQKLPVVNAKIAGKRKLRFEDERDMAPKKEEQVVSADNENASVLSTKERILSIVNMNKFRESLPSYKIEGVRFSFTGDDLIKRLTPFECTSSEYTGEYSVNSPSMGTVDRNRACSRCGKIDIACPGHQGRVELATPIPHPLAVDLIIYILRSVCSNCGKLLLPEYKRKDPNILRLKGVQRLREISRIVSSGSGTVVMCPSSLNWKTREDNVEIGDGSGDKTQHAACPLQNPKYCSPKDKDQWQIIASVKIGDKELVTRVSIERVKNIFRNIPAEDLKILGFEGDSHPSNFIMQYLPIIPERCRPPVERDGERKQDHITLVYATIIRENRKLKALMEEKESHGSTHTSNGGSIENQISTLTRNLFFIISHVFNNTDGKLKLRLGDAASTLADRIAGKEGFCRAHSQGKRVDFCARDVIGPAVVPFGAILVPDIMRVLTIPEKVNRFNIDRIRRLVDTNEIAHITRGSGIEKGIIKGMPQTEEDRKRRHMTGATIVIGDIVERLGDTGDAWTLNRQPTLHRHSMIGVYTIFKKNRYTFGLHCGYTAPLNADFDGDESNINNPQTLEARCEIRDSGRSILSGVKILRHFAGDIIDFYTNRRARIISPRSVAIGICLRKEVLTIQSSFFDGFAHNPLDGAFA